MHSIAARKLTLVWVALLITGCGSAPEADSARVKFDPSPRPSAPDAPPQPAEAVAGILDFTAPRLGGGRVVGSEFAGQNVAVWFWAPW
jgi:hypothetical protein